MLLIDRCSRSRSSRFSWLVEQVSISNLLRCNSKENILLEKTVTIGFALTNMASAKLKQLKSECIQIINNVIFTLFFYIQLSFHKNSPTRTNSCV